MEEAADPSELYTQVCMCDASFAMHLQGWSAQLSLPESPGGAAGADRARRVRRAH